MLFFTTQYYCFSISPIVSLTQLLPLYCLSSTFVLSLILLPLSTPVSVPFSAHRHDLSLVFTLTPSLHLPSPSLSLPLSSLSRSSPLFNSSSPLSSHRQSSLSAAAASFCSLFAANGPLVCCVQGNKSHQAGTLVPRLPLDAGQSGQFAMV